MPLDVEPVEPPELDPEVDASSYDDADVAGTTDYRREELNTFLQGDAWADAWEQWLRSTDLTEAEFEIARDLNLFERFDFFWDAFAERVGYHAPGLPEDWKERGLHSELDSWTKVSSINASLTELGQIVCETLKADYVDWESDYDPPDDLPDFEA
jgi:hypothetical protein